MILRAYVGAAVRGVTHIGSAKKTFDEIYRQCPAGHRYAVVVVDKKGPRDKHVEFWCIDLARALMSIDNKGMQIGKYLVFPTYEAAVMYALLRHNHTDDLLTLGWPWSEGRSWKMNCGTLVHNDTLTMRLEMVEKVIDYRAHGLVILTGIISWFVIMGMVAGAIYG